MRLNEKIVKHSVGVAEFMADWAEKHTKFQFDPNEMYVLGLLHDIGKLYPGEMDANGRTSYKGHAKKGGKLLADMGFYDWREIAHHGHPEENFWSVKLLLLNMADLSVNGKGEIVPIPKRLESIKFRYGENSDEYKRAMINFKDLINYKFITADGKVIDTDE